MKAEYTCQLLVQRVQGEIPSDGNDTGILVEPWLV